MLTYQKVLVAHDHKNLMQVTALSLVQIGLSSVRFRQCFGTAWFQDSKLQEGAER
jgi:hypothetical protein